MEVRLYLTGLVFSYVRADKPWDSYLYVLICGEQGIAVLYCLPNGTARWHMYSDGVVVQML